MTRPRITFAIEASSAVEFGELRIYLNPEGRDLLVRELNGLSEQSDHIHLNDESWAFEIPLKMKAYVPDKDAVLDSVKILFRPDEWDREHFPHVMSGEGAP